MTRSIIFLGPSLPVEAAKKLLPFAQYRPPIARDDLPRALDERPEIIGIVDGSFLQTRAVSPKEILAALESGVVVLGAASMGALRAVELAPYGMVGVGSVYQWFKQGRLVADDEVAIAYDPETGRATSEPLVNIRYALSRALAAGRISTTTRRELIRLAKDLYFPDRSYPRVLQLARGRVPERDLRSLAAWLVRERPDLKADDARRLLKRVGRLAAHPCNQPQDLTRLDRKEIVR